MGSYNKYSRPFSSSTAAVQIINWAILSKMRFLNLLLGLLVIACICCDVTSTRWRSRFSSRHRTRTTPYLYKSWRKSYPSRTTYAQVPSQKSKTWPYPSGKYRSGDSKSETNPTYRNAQWCSGELCGRIPLRLYERLHKRGRVGPATSQLPDSRSGPKSVVSFQE